MSWSFLKFRICTIHFWAEQPGSKNIVPRIKQVFYFWWWHCSLIFIKLRNRKVHICVPYVSILPHVALIETLSLWDLYFQYVSLARSLSLLLTSPLLPINFIYLTWDNNLNLEAAKSFTSPKIIPNVFPRGTSEKDLENILLLLFFFSGASPSPTGFIFH